jgi:cell division protein FtsB
MISALSRQSDLNRFTAHLLHNLVLELTRLNLEVQELRNRNLQLAGRVETLARRAKTLEDMVGEREGAKDQRR